MRPSLRASAAGLRDKDTARLSGSAWRRVKNGRSSGAIRRSTRRSDSSRSVPCGRVISMTSSCRVRCFRPSGRPWFCLRARSRFAQDQRQDQACEGDRE
jgi:hypothetical protein